MPYFSHDDIAQIGTPSGPSPVGALRLSGDNALAILAQVSDVAVTAGTDSPSRRVVDGVMRIPLAGDVVPCPARFLVMPAPATYTREPMAEIHLPGSPPLLRAALTALVDAGARPAAPGEFTFRAFRNGRIGLGQAEAVERLIRSTTEAERRQALSRLGDRDGAAIRRWRDDLFDIAARVEAVLDFADEELEPGIEADLARLAQQLAASAAGRAERGPERAGRRIALAGLTNAGKSSLFNALLGEDAVLVSEDASTTRDSIRRRVVFDTVEVELSDNPGFDPDTAGQGGDAAARGGTATGGDDIVLWVVDASRHLDAQDVAFASSLTGGVLLVLNKSDLRTRTEARQAASLLDGAEATLLGDIAVSAATGDGIAALRSEIARLAASLSGDGGWNRRELLELAAARECCRRAAEELAHGGRLELAAEELRHGVLSFSRMMGEGYAEEALGRIFSRFCIGK
ncbi:MAG: 50S ribosome-binding GTPase [Planctomycetaceae bacterium]|nr:50S ribosome-binding GTPase [Planctomycetaceae bacterium]